MPNNPPAPDRGIPIAISSPSGGGKTTIIREVRKLRPELGYSVSCTTRKPRPGEVNGKDYIFLTETEFQERAEKGEFLEWEWVHGYQYGTLKETVLHSISLGQSLLFDIDVFGARSLKKAFPESLLIFLNPPNLEILINRLTSRAEDSLDEIKTRLERVKMEAEIGREFETIIINDVLADTVQQVIAAIDDRLKSR